MGVVIAGVALTVGAVAGAAEMVSTALVHSVSCRTACPPSLWLSGSLLCMSRDIDCSHKIQ